MNAEVLALAPAIVFLGILFFLLPNLTRPELFFAVTVERGFRRCADGSRIVRRYRMHVAVVTAFALVLLLVPGTVPARVLPPATMFGQLAALVAAFLAARRATQPFAVAPTTVCEAELAAWKRAVPGGLAVALGPLFLLLLVGLAAWLRWADLPDRLPVHWGFSGPDRWVERTPARGWGLFLLNGSVTAMICLSAWGVSQAVGRVVTTGAEAAAEFRFRRLTVWLLLLVAYLASLPLALTVLAPEAAQSPAVMNAWGALLLAGVLISVAALIWMGQGGNRLAGPDRESITAPPAGDRRTDACWKWGMFYVNPDDPAIFIEKRFGIGYTLNFGNPWAWAAIALLAPSLISGILLLR
jgi:uncharacterized membrane protein